MAPRSSWVHSTTFKNSRLHSEAGAIVNPIDTDGHDSGLESQIDAWPIDRDSNEGPLASPTNFYRAYLLRCNQVDLDLETAKAEPDVEEPTNRLSQFMAGEPAQKELGGLPRIKQEPDSIEEKRPMLIPARNSQELLVQSSNKMKLQDQDNRIHCRHCRKTVQGEARYGLCVNCAFCVKTKCELCSSMVMDTESHMKRHSEGHTFQCVIEGCGKSFATERGRSLHQAMVHAAVFHCERKKRRERRRRKASRWISDPGGSLSGSG